MSDFEIIERRTGADESSKQAEIELVSADRDYSEPTPIKDRILVLQDSAETTYNGTKIIVPESARQNPNKGAVVSVGPDLCPKENKDGTYTPGPVKPGDIVTFGRFNAEQIQVGNELFQLVAFDDVKLIESVSYALGV